MVGSAESKHESRDRPVASETRKRGAVKEKGWETTRVVEANQIDGSGGDGFLVYNHHLERQQY